MHPEFMSQLFNFDDKKNLNIFNYFFGIRIYYEKLIFYLLKKLHNHF